MYFQKQRLEMVKRLTKMGIVDERVLNAMSIVPRELFVSKGLEFQAYDEKALPIGFGQTISHPYTVAKMTEELSINKGEKVLEIGTGSGYQAAVLCQLGVILYSIEIKNELYKKAKSVLKSLKYSAVLKNGDGSSGWNAYSPYSAIIVTAGVKIVPNELFNQLKDGGRIVAPVGRKDKQTLTIYTKIKDDIIEKSLSEFSFVPMTGVKGLEN